MKLRSGYACGVLLFAAASIIPAAGCATNPAAGSSPQHDEDASAGELITRTIVTLGADGVPQSHDETVSRAQQRAEFAEREAAAARSAGRPAPAPLIARDTGCSGPALWLFSGPGLTGSQLCFQGAGTLDLGTYGFGALVRSYWAGSDSGKLAFQGLASDYDCTDPFGPYARRDAVVPCAAIANTLALGSVPSARLALGTFNVQFTTSIAADHAYCGCDDDYECRAAKIAARVLASPYDVIAFNEVFDEDARDKLEELLAPAFPYYLAKIEDAQGHEDSGLMLFSKHPFLAPAREDCLADAGYLTAKAAGSDYAKLGFLGYGPTCQNEDCWAAKGVAYARFVHRETGMPFSVAITHTQATYGSDHYFLKLNAWELRRAQLASVDALLTCSMAPGARNREPVFVMGDLNIDGLQSLPDLGPTEVDGNRWEWEAEFGLGGAHWNPAFSTSDGLRDQWVATTSPSDLGASTSAGGERLDYVLSNVSGGFAGGGGLCVQHMTLARNLKVDGVLAEGGLGEGGVCNPSDHLGVNADVNLWAPRCSPAQAMVSPPLDTPIAGEIVHPGNVQWYFVDDPHPYTYGIGIFGGAGVTFRVYDAEDLSVPLPAYHGETISTQLGTLDKFVPSGPFYIKVYSPNPSWTGGYRLALHKNDCSTRANACELRPDEQLPMTMTAPYYEGGAMWFRVHADRAWTGAPQDFRFGIHQQSTPTVSLEIYDGGGVLVANASPSYYPSGAWSAQTGFTGLLDGQTFLVAARRSGTAPVTFTMWWTSNLGIFHGDRQVPPGASSALAIPGARELILHCDQTTEGFGPADNEDEISIEVVVDGIPYGSYDLGDFEDDDNGTIPLPAIRYLHGIEVRVLEEDTVSDEVGSFHVPAPDALLLAGKRTVGPSLAVDLDPGRYQLWFNVSRSLESSAP